MCPAHSSGDCCGSPRPRKFANDGTKNAKYHEAVSMAIEITFTTPSEGLHTPRTCLLRYVGVFLYRSPDKDWNDEEEMKGWVWEKSRTCCPTTVSATTTFLMCENATRSPEDAAPLFRRCVSSACLLKQ